jgi:acyl carrier protein
MSQQTLTIPEALAMLAEAFDEPVESLNAQRERDTVPGWDSMGALILIAELDENFGIELTAEASREMRRVQDVLDFLAQHGVLKG